MVQRKDVRLGTSCAIEQLSDYICFYRYCNPGSRLSRQHFSS